MSLDTTACGFGLFWIDVSPLLPVVDPRDEALKQAKACSVATEQRASQLDAQLQQERQLRQNAEATATKAEQRAKEAELRVRQMEADLQQEQKGRRALEATATLSQAQVQDLNAQLEKFQVRSL